MTNKVFEGIDWANGKDRGYHVVTIGPDATPKDVQAFRDAYDLGCAWYQAEAALPDGWHMGEVKNTSYRGINPDGQSERWLAMAWADADERTFDFAYGDTPTEALRSLSARLSKGT